MKLTELIKYPPFTCFRFKQVGSPRSVLTLYREYPHQTDFVLYACENNRLHSVGTHLAGRPLDFYRGDDFNHVGKEVYHGFRDLDIEIVFSGCHYWYYMNHLFNHPALTPVTHLEEGSLVHTPPGITPVPSFHHHSSKYAEYVTSVVGYNHAGHSVLRLHVHARNNSHKWSTVTLLNHDRHYSSLTCDLPAAKAYTVGHVATDKVLREVATLHQGLHDTNFDPLSIAKYMQQLDDLDLLKDTLNHTHDEANDLLVKNRKAEQQIKELQQQMAQQTKAHATATGLKDDLIEQLKSKIKELKESAEQAKVTPGSNNDFSGTMMVLLNHALQGEPLRFSQPVTFNQPNTTDLCLVMHVNVMAATVHYTFNITKGSALYPTLVCTHGGIAHSSGWEHLKAAVNKDLEQLKVPLRLD